MSIFSSDYNWIQCRWFVDKVESFTQEEKDAIREITVVSDKIGKAAQIVTLDGKTILIYIEVDSFDIVEEGQKLNKNMLSVVILKFGIKNWRGKFIPIGDRDNLYLIRVPKEAVML